MISSIDLAIALDRRDQMSFERRNTKIDPKCFLLVPKTGDVIPGSCPCGHKGDFIYERGIPPRCKRCGRVFWAGELGRYRGLVSGIDITIPPERRNGGLWEFNELWSAIATGVQDLESWLCCTSQRAGGDNSGRDFLDAWYYFAQRIGRDREVKPVVHPGYLDHGNSYPNSVVLGAHVSYKEMDYKAPDFNIGQWRPLGTTGPVWCHLVSQDDGSRLTSKGTQITLPELTRF